MSEISDDLRAAADYISEHGWHQGALSDRDGGAVCALGALLASRNLSSYRDGIAALMTHLGLGPRSRTEPHPVARWNDAPERTKEDVVLAFKRAAEEWE